MDFWYKIILKLRYTLNIFVPLYDIIYKQWFQRFKEWSAYYIILAFANQSPHYTSLRVKKFLMRVDKYTIYVYRLYAIIYCKSYYFLIYGDHNKYFFLLKIW